MIDYRTDRKIREFVGWLMAGFLLLTMLTSCVLPTPGAPVTFQAGISPTPSAAPIPPGNLPEGTTPAPYWQLAAGDPWRLINPVNYGGRIGY